MNSVVVVGGGVGVVALITGLTLFLRHARHRRPATSTDSTAARLAENHVVKGSLKDTENEKIRSDIILRSIDDGVILLDDQKHIQMFNPAAEIITGWKVSEAIGIDVENVIQLVDDKGVAYDKSSSPLSRILNATETIRDNGANLKTRSGKLVPIALSLSPLVNESRHTIGAVAIFRDVTQERNEEKQHAEFISTASHEMRTPVAAIEGYLALALNDKVSKIDSKARDYLQKAHDSTQHLGNLFQDLLTAAKSEDGRLSNHPTVVEMGTFLEQLVEGMRFTAEKKGLTTEFVLGTSGETVDASGSNTKVIKPLYYVHVDADRMREVITNLFDNAIKYSEQGKITIGLTGDKDVVQIRVADTGSGIPAEDIPHLFQKFYRVDSSLTRGIGGTGLGLFICRKIVELYQGRIWVESTLGVGSTFYINLPRLTTEKANELKAAEATTLQPLATAGTTV